MGTILVVDDERSIRETVKAFLEADGHGVEAAEDVDSAVTLFRTIPFDVVLTDIILPRATGMDLLRQVRDMSPHVQVIVMTGEPTLETAFDALRLGAVDYLQKPVGKTEILKAVQNALRVKSLIDEKRHFEQENSNYLSHLEKLVAERTHALAASEATLRHRADELSILNRLARRVNESVTADESIRCGLQEIAQAAACDLALFFLRKGEELVLMGANPEPSATKWHPRQVHRLGSCLCGLAVLEGRATYAGDIRSDPRCTIEECRQAGFRSFAALPLGVGSANMGVLGIASLQPRNFLEQAPFLEAMAYEMAIGLNKSLLVEQVQQHARELRESLSRVESAERDRLMLLQHLQRSQKMEAIGTLASGIAHDFNNILGAVIGYTELALLDTPREAKAGKNLEMVLAASQRAKDLVRQILAFGRSSEEERKPLRIGHVVEEVLKFMRASLPATVEIRHELDAAIGTVLADAVQIHQIFMNLCTNAHHAMREKGGVLTVKTAGVHLGPENAPICPELKPGPYVKVTVKDTGHGMEEATLARIFDPYFTTKDKQVGTGLGLAVVHGLVRKHGGALTVESAPGQGATFDVYFPVIHKEPLPETRQAEQMVPGHERILLVDDEHSLVEMGRQMLEHLGYQVETCTGSMEALAQFRERPDRFDLVVTDMTMPNLTGDRLAVELMRIRPDIPIVVCTGYHDRILEEKARAIGIKALVNKPVTMAQMARAIRKALTAGKASEERGTQSEETVPPVGS